MSRGRRISRVKLIPPSEETADRYLLECDHKRLYQSPESFPKLTAKEIFNAGGPISLDIGCGTGEFLLATAETHPEEFFLGIEISRRAIYHAVHLAEKRKLANLKFLKADFALLYPLIPEKSLNRVYLNFPDPNYGGAKKRKQRIFSPRFLDLMAAALNKDGRIQVVTDQHRFLTDMLKIAEGDPRFVTTHPEQYLTDFSPPAKTRFQIAWEKFDRPIFRFELALA